MSEDRCVPLCGADIAYGRRAGWWKHEPLCPARDGRKPGAKRESVECRRCRGSGEVWSPASRGRIVNEVCPDCNGTGRTPENVEEPT